MTTQNTPRQTFFAVETGDGYRIEATVKGFVDSDAEGYALEILAVAEHMFRDVFSSDFTEQILDLYEHKFRARLDAESEPSEFDLGWSAGRQSALLEVELDRDVTDPDPGTGHVESMVGKTLEVTSVTGGHGFPVGTKVEVVLDDEDGNPECRYLATTREDNQSEKDWRDQWEHGVTAYVGTANTKVLDS